MNECGFFCVDADEVVKELYRKGESGQRLVLNNFGSDFLDKKGDVDKKRLRELVYKDQLSLKKLNKLIHPLVFNVIKGIIEAKEGENVAIEAAYFEKNALLNLIDRIVWMERDKKQIFKVLKDRGLSDKQAKFVFESVKKPEKIDFRIGNFGSLNDLEKQVKSICF